MTREQWNVTYCLCWLAAIALAYATSGAIAAVAMFFLPTFLIAAWIGLLARFGIDWDRRPRAIKPRHDQPDEHQG